LLATVLILPHRSLAECITYPVRRLFIGSSDVAVARVVSVAGFERTVSPGRSVFITVEATLSVERRFLGRGPSTITVVQTGDGIDLLKDHRYLVFVRSDGNKLYNSSCATLPLEEAGAALSQLRRRAWLWRIERRVSMWRHER